VRRSCLQPPYPRRLTYHRADLGGSNGDCARFTCAEQGNEMARWNVDDALRVTARFADWLSTADANRLTQQHVWDFVGEQLEADNVPAEDAANESNASLAHAIRSQDPIWCDPNMVDLLAVATAELPDMSTVEAWQLPYPVAGLVILSKPLPTDWRGAMNPQGDLEDMHDEISAITWERPFENRWVIRSWARGSGVFRFKGVDHHVRCPDLRPSAVVELLGEQQNQAPVARILMALTALSRTADSVGETRELASKAARLRASKAGMPDPRVRRLYLHRPAAGAQELEALRAERQGSPRGHWVRGHWRNQWYPSIEEHRLRWIDGFPRGDFTQGTVSGERIQIARPPKP